MKRGGRQSPSINPNFRTMKRVLDMVVTVTAGKTHAGQGEKLYSSVSGLQILTPARLTTVWIINVSHEPMC